MLAAFATTILFSLSAVCGNRTSKLLGGTEANFWRLLFATVLLGVYAHGWTFGLTGAAFPFFLLSGCIGFGVGDVALFQALPRLGSRLSMIFVACLSAPIAAMVEYFWLGIELSAAEIAAGLLILSGVAVALAPTKSVMSSQTPALEAPGKNLSARQGTMIAGIVFGSIAAVCQAIGAVLSRKAFAIAQAAGENIDGLTAAYQRILGGVILTGVCLLVVKRRALLQAFGARPAAAMAARESRQAAWKVAWPLVLLNGLAGPTLGVSCYQYALKTAPTGIVMPIVAITPLVIIPFSIFLEGERPSGRSIVGGLIAVGGAVLLASVAAS